MTKTIRLNATHYFIMKIPNKREFQQIAFNHSSDIDFKDFVKLYKDCTKEPCSFLVNDITYHPIIHYNLGRIYYKMRLVRKLKQSITKSSKTKLNTI